MKTSDMERLIPLAPAAYLVAIVLMVIPVADVAVSLVPLHPGDVSWRFGALGLGSQAVMTPLLGALLAFVTAAVLGHRRALRVLQILAWLAAVTMLVASVLFVLDAVQTRATVRGTAKIAFEKASAAALAKYIIGVVVSMTFAIAGQRVIRGMRAHDASESDTPILVHSSRAES